MLVLCHERGAHKWEGERKRNGERVGGTGGVTREEWVVKGEDKKMPRRSESLLNEKKEREGLGEGSGGGGKKLIM